MTTENERAARPEHTHEEILALGLYQRPDGLRYDPEAVMDMPRGARVTPDVVKRPPLTEARSGKALAATLMFAQLPLDPRRLSAQPEGKSTKLSSAQRRAARIAAGKLAVTPEGQLYRPVY